MEIEIQKNTNRNRERNGVDFKKDLLFFESLNSSSFKWLTTKEAAEYLRTTPKQIRKWVYQGKVKAFKLCGKSLRYKLVDLELLLKGGQSWG
jgi:excisionase family DNA binding protein